MERKVSNEKEEAKEQKRTEKTKKIMRYTNKKLKRCLNTTS